MKNCKQFCEKDFIVEREKVEDAYCQTKCTNKKKWLKSFTKKRREKLMNQGAISGCRDLMKEFPTYYKNL